MPRERRITEATTHELRGLLRNDVVNRFRWKHNLADLQAMSREVETNDAGRVIVVEMLCHQRVTDAKLNVLQQFPTIERLVAMGGSDLTDEGLSELHALKNLRDLTVYSHVVTDAGLQHLGNNNPGLQKIHLRTREVTTAGHAWLKAKLPAAEISLED